MKTIMDPWEKSDYVIYASKSTLKCILSGDFGRLPRKLRDELFSAAEIPLAPPAGPASEPDKPGAVDWTPNAIAAVVNARFKDHGDSIISLIDRMTKIERRIEDHAHAEAVSILVRSIDKRIAVLEGVVTMTNASDVEFCKDSISDLAERVNRIERRQPVVESLAEGARAKGEEALNVLANFKGNIGTIESEIERLTHHAVRDAGKRIAALEKRTAAAAKSPGERVFDKIMSKRPTAKPAKKGKKK